MQDVRLRLLIAVVASAALHLTLVFGVAVRTPLPESFPIVARLEAGIPVPHASVVPTLSVATAPRHAQGAAPAKRRASEAQREWTSLSRPGPRMQGEATLPAVQPDSALPDIEMVALADPTWYQPDQLDVYPRILSALQAAYPTHAKEERIGGEVTMLVSIDERGTVQDVSVAQAAPAGYFEAAAIAALRSARFDPARKDGRSVRSRLLVRVAFDPALAVQNQQGNLSPRRHEDTKNGKEMQEEGVAVDRR
jgi:protein TonB